jgi:uncharacterized protein (TIGR03435 family)
MTRRRSIGRAAGRGLGLAAFLTFAAGGFPSASAQQSQATQPAYEVSVIKPHPSGNDGSSIGTRDNSFTAVNVSLRTLISNAFDIRPDLISGLPQWAEDAHYDLTAKTLDPNLDALSKLTGKQRDAMLAAVLESRFELRVHEETKQLPVYDLAIAKGGSKLKPTIWTDPTIVPKGADSGLPPGSIQIRTDSVNVQMTATAIPVFELAVNLALVLQRTVIDTTGLSGKYDLSLKWMSNDASMSAASTPTNSDEVAAPPIFKAIEEQLGLKLVAAKGPVRTVVVDHVERPSPN